MEDRLQTHGMFESWLVDKKTGEVVAGSYQKEHNTILTPLNMFNANMFVVSPDTSSGLTNSSLFDESVTGSANITDAWLTAHGTNGIVYMTALPSGYDTKDFDEDIAIDDTDAVCKTVASSVGETDENSFIITGELEGAYVKSSGYFVLVSGMFETDTEAWDCANVFMSKSQALNISEDRVYYFKWTVTF